MYIKTVILTSSFHFKSQTFSGKKIFQLKSRSLLQQNNKEMRQLDLFKKKKVSTLYMGKFNWLQMLNQLIQNSWGSNFIELQVSMYYLVWSSFLVQTNYKTKLMPGLLLSKFFCNT